MNELERRTIMSLELRSVSDGKPQIAGYFANFGSLSDPLREPQVRSFFKERMTPGALARSLTDGREIRAHYEHLRHVLLGSTTAGTYRLREDQNGLHGEIDLPNTTDANNLAENMRLGNIRGASIGFRDVKGGVKWSQEDGWDVRTVSDLNLIEGTVTAYPAFKSTSLSVRSLFADIGDDDALLICRALNRVEQKLDVVDEDRDVLREYRSELNKSLPVEQRALMDQLLEPAKQVMRPGDVLTWLDIAETGALSD